MTMKAKAVKLDRKEKYTRLFSAKDGSALSLRSGHVILREDNSVGEHDTGDSEEIIIALEGRGRIEIAGHEKIDFEKNTALYVPPRTMHDVKNTGKSDLRYIFITSPAKSYGKV